MPCIDVHHDRGLGVQRFIGIQHHQVSLELMAVIHTYLMHKECTCIYLWLKLDCHMLCNANCYAICCNLIYAHTKLIWRGTNTVSELYQLTIECCHNNSPQNTAYMYLYVTLSIKYYMCITIMRPDIHCIVH